MRRPTVNIILRRAIVLFFILIISRITLFAQFDTIWYEGFNNANGLGSIWFVDTSNADLSPIESHFEVKNGVFSANFLDSIAIWKTKNFFIGDKSSVGIKLRVYSPFTEIDDSLQIYYSIDDNDSILLHEFNGVINTSDVHSCYGEGIAGDSIKLIVRIFNDDIQDTLSFDDILIFSNKPLEIFGEDTVCSLATSEVYIIQEQNEHSYWWESEIGTIQGDNANDTIVINWPSELDNGLLIVYDTTSTFNCAFSDTLRIEVGDFEPPTITELPDDTLYLTDSCWIVIPDYLSSINASDNCGGIFSQTQTPSADTILNPAKYKHNATIQIAIKVVDDSYILHETYDTINVLILDTIPTRITYNGEDPVELSTLSSTCSSTSIDIDGVFIDDCSDLDTTYTMTGSTTGSGSGFVTNQQFIIGTTNVKYIFTDIAGNKDSVTIDVIVKDDVRPTLTCPSDTVVKNDGTNCSAIVNNIDLREVSDNCTDSASLSIKHVLSSNINDTIVGYASGTQFNIDTTTVTYIVTDAASNIAIDSFLVIVNDSTPPNISLQGGDTVLWQNDINQCYSTIDIDTAIANDNCGGSPTISGVRDDALELDDPYPLGETTITWTATDAKGNDSIAEQLVIVSDTSKPVFTQIPGDISLPAETGVCTAEINFGRTILDATDNCSIDSIWNNNSNDSDTTLTFSVGTETLHWFVVDYTGNTDTISLEVTVDDTQKPTFTPPKDTTINYGSSIDSIELGYPTNLDDNCTNTSNITISHTDNIISGACPVIDTLKRTWHLIDEALNDSIWIQNIVRIDTSVPDINTQNITVILPESTGFYTISYLDIDIGTKDSTAFKMWLSDSTFDCSYIGDTTIIFYAQDYCGNIDSSEFTVTVEYKTDPEITILPYSDTICSGSTTAIDLGGNIWMNFYWSVIGNSDITGFSAFTDSIGGTIGQSLNNASDENRFIDYIITPRIYSKCLLTDKKDTVRIWVEPVPKVSPIVLIDTICNGEFANIKLETPTNPTDSIRFDVLVLDPSNFINGDNNENRIDPNDSIYQALTNVSDEIHYVDYIITPFLLNNEGSEVCKSTDNNDTVRIYINPSPDLDVELTTADTICNLSNIQINVSSLNPTIGGSAFYSLDVDTIPGTLEGIRADDNYSLNDIINDTPKNLTDSVQIITYRFTPWFDDVDSEVGSCEGVEDTTITIYIEPTPRVTVTPSADTICNTEEVTLTLASNANPTLPVRFNYESITPTGVSLSNSGATGLHLSDNIITEITNNTDTVKLVKLVVKPYTTTGDGSTLNCSGINDTAYIWVEPSTNVTASPQLDTICEGENISVVLNSSSEPTLPVKFRYTTQAPTGVVVSPANASGLDDDATISNQIDNNTDTAQLVKFIITPYSTEGDGATEKCAGTNDTAYIWVEPSTNVTASPQQDTICAGENISVVLNSSSEPTLPVKFRYTTQAPTGVVVSPANASGLDDDATLSNQIDNNTDTAQLVKFIITPYSTEGDAVTEKCAGANDTAYIWVEPSTNVTASPQQDTICDGKNISVTLNSSSEPTLPVKFKYTTQAPAGVTVSPANGSGLDDDATISNQIDNNTDTAQLVKFIITPYSIEENGATEKCAGTNDTAYIWVEPSTNVTASPQQDTICDGGNISVTLSSSSEPTLPVKFRYSTQAPAGVTISPNTDSGLSNNHTLTNQIDNNTDEAQLVKFIITPYTTEGNGATEKCAGTNDTAYIWINPTPKLEIINIIPDTIICDSTNLIIEINSLNGNIIGEKKYRLTTSYILGAVEGVQVTDIYNITDTIKNVLVNLTDSVQKITYQIEALFENVSFNKNSCGNGSIKIVTIYLNPTPKLNISVTNLIPETDTLFCDLDEVQFNLNSINGNVIGEKIFTLETNFISGAVDGIQNQSDYYFGTNNSFEFNNQLDNLTDSFQIIEYTFKARIKNPRTGLTYCDNGMDTTIRIYVNPTPTIDVQIDDTVYCDNSALNFDITNTTGKIVGELFYQLLINFNSDSVTNTIGQGNYTVDTDITDNLTNHSFKYQILNYQFTPKISDNRPGKGGVMKCNGESKNIDIYVNPTPRISVVVVDTIYCNNSSVDFLVSSVTSNENIIGDLQFDIESIASGTISGSSNGIMNQSLENFSDVLNNETADLQYIDYTLTPKINNVPSSSQASCGNGITASIRVHITPTFETNAISLTRDSIVGGWDVKCFGDKTAQASVNTVGGYVSVEGYTEDDVSYEWHKDGGDDYNTKTITQLGSGIYNVTATDLIGCLATSSIELKEPDLLVAEINIIDNLVCEGDKNGSMQAIINGGTKDYDVTWIKLGFNPDTLYTEYIDSLVEANYELYVTDANECQTYDTEFIGATNTMGVLSYYPDVLRGKTPVSLNGYHIACYGGTLDSTVFRGKEDYSYELIYPNDDTLNFETDYTIIRDLPAGSYELIATDINSCQSIYTFNLLQPDSISIGNIDFSSYDTFNISCYGKKDGYIHLNNITGGIDYNENTYIYEWENPEYDSLSQYVAGIIQNKAHQDNLISGTYYATIKNGICEYKDTFILHEPEEIQIQATIKSYSGGFNISCFNKSDGEISVGVKGGYIPDGSYTYSWSNGNNDSIITGLSAKTYSLTVEDDIECKTTKSYALMQPEEMYINYNLSDYSGYNIRCFGGQGGSIDLIPSGGDNTSYSYQWKTLDGEGILETAKNQSGLTAGNYRVIVTDGNSCIDSTTIELDQPELLSILEIVKQDVSCDGKIKGFAEVIETGGAGINTYLWSNGETSKRIENLNALFFTVTVTDINDCQTVGSVQVEKTDSLDIELLPVEQYSGEVISCYGSNDGEIIAHVTYGQRPYTYTWSTDPSDTDSIISNLSQGRYDVTITDNLQCKGIETIFIEHPNPIDAEINIVNATCNNFSDGNVSLNTFGGTGPYTFNWLNADINNIPNYSGLKAGNYGVTIIDANNCKKDTLFAIEQPTSLGIDYEIDKPFCPDMKDGSIIAIAKGGTPGYNYSWNIGNKSDFIDGLDENDYIVTITDANQCEFIDTVELKSDARDCLDIPTAFTPNGDGYNDTWEIVVSSDKYPQLPKVGDIYPEVTVEIYNRWGELIFISQNGYEKEWDGKNMKNGKDLPIDSYHYVIDFGDGRARTGNVTIIR